MTATSTQSPGPYLVGRRQAMAELGLSRSKFAAIVERGDLVLEKIGPHYYVPAAQLEALIARWSAPAPTDEARP